LDAVLAALEVDGLLDFFPSKSKSTAKKGEAIL
jgi:hypothetical protein